MNIALLQLQLTLHELTQLSREFPQLLFLSFPPSSLKPISKEHWQKTEVLFGDRLTADDLEAANQLRWIHTPSPNLNRLCLKEIKEQGNILITSTREENVIQIGEFVLAVVLAYAKNLFEWKAASAFPALVWDCKWRNKMWSLKNKIFLQIGMGKKGVEIARRASFAGFQVWGMDETRSFHPHCIKNFGLSELHSVLPAADVVSIAIPRERGLIVRLGKEELNLMKQDSVLTVIGSSQHFDEDALTELCKRGKFRGILLDAIYQTPIPPQSKLWKIPNLLITPEVAPRPKTFRDAFRIFRFNLRQYLHGNYSDMKNLVDPSVAEMPVLEES